MDSYAHRSPADGCYPAAAAPAPLQKLEVLLHSLLCIQALQRSLFVVGQFLGFSVMVGSWWLTLVGLSYLLRYANPSEHGDYDRSIWFE